MKERLLFFFPGFVSPRGQKEEEEMAFAASEIQNTRGNGKTSIVMIDARKSSKQE